MKGLRIGTGCYSLLLLLLFERERERERDEDSGRERYDDERFLFIY